MNTEPDLNRLMQRLTEDNLKNPKTVLGEYAERFQERLLQPVAEIYVRRARKEGAETPDEIIRCVKYLLDQGFKEQ